MSKKLTGDDVGILNETIRSADKNISQKAKDKLVEYVHRPDSFADSIAEDWAKRIYRRISRAGYQPGHA